MSSYTYRKIYEHHNGEIPKDSDGRTFEIHHRDGNRANNDINNLQCVSIQEHYDIHYSQGDYGACVMIAKRMCLPKEHLSDIQRGKKRPGIGGRKKGCVGWNKGLRYKVNLTEEGRAKKIEIVKKNAKISDELANQIRKDFDNLVEIDNPKIGKIQRNGKTFTYETAFCEHYAQQFDVTKQYIFRILRRTSKIV